MAKITKQIIDGLKPTDRDQIVWDSELRGFGVRVKPSGAKSYIIQYRNRQKRSRRLTIGTHGRLTPTEARREARGLLASVDSGHDPVAKRADERNLKTLAEFADDYLADAPGWKKASTLETDRINLRCHILPALGRMHVAAITRVDVQRFYRGMKNKPGAANRTIQLLSNMLNYAEEMGVRSPVSNPCRGIRRYKERKRERYLSASELTQLGDVLAAAERTGTESSSSISAIRLLILTGCRRGEILSLRWEDVDFENQCLHLVDSKTGPRTVHLNAPALAVLGQLERKEDNPFVITGAKEGSHLINLKKPWQRMRKAAGLENVRIHDLRHSFASVSVGLGESLYITGKLLGHTQSETTQRYAHLADDPLKAANERVGVAIANMMAGQNAEVTTLRKRNS